MGEIAAESGIQLFNQAIIILSNLEKYNLICNLAQIYAPAMTKWEKYLIMYCQQKTI